MSITNAMESTRLSLEHLGKLSFAQMTELVNCTMNRGLPSCLAGSSPSTNYHCKGLDIHIAAYTSELGYLAAPVSTHVQVCFAFVTICTFSLMSCCVSLRSSTIKLSTRWL